MTKPKNMTPEQEAAWRAKQAERRSSPEAKAKQKARFDRWYAEQGGKEKIVSRTKAIRATPEGREKRNAYEREALANSQEKRDASVDRQRKWRESETGKLKNCEKTKRNYKKKKLDAEYDAFIASISDDAGEDVE